MFGFFNFHFCFYCPKRFKGNWCRILTYFMFIVLATSWKHIFWKKKLLFKENIKLGKKICTNWSNEVRPKLMEPATRSHLNKPSVYALFCYHAIEQNASGPGRSETPGWRQRCQENRGGGNGGNLVLGDRILFISPCCSVYEANINCCSASSSSSSSRFPFSG